MKHFVADTHALLWFFLARQKLGRAAARLFAAIDVTTTVHVSSITLWEVALLCERGDVHLNAGFSAWQNAVLHFPGLHVEPLMPEDVEEARSLAGLVDPADRLIAGTARRLGVPLISKDQRMKRHGRVPLVW
jgi:PIN domain nuclease of toxin-antitoxin system